MKAKIVAIVQARVASSRLPRKVLAEVCGKTILEHVLERVSAAALVTKVVVATTTAHEDDEIVARTQDWGAEAYRGERVNVLSRYYGAASQFEAAIVVRITADNPLCDPHLI